MIQLKKEREHGWFVLISHLCEVGQSRQGTGGTGSNPTRGHHIIQGAAVTAEAGVVAIVEAILGE